MLQKTLLRKAQDARLPKANGKFLTSLKRIHQSLLLKSKRLRKSKWKVKLKKMESNQKRRSKRLRKNQNKRRLPQKSKPKKKKKLEND